MLRLVAAALIAATLVGAGPPERDPAAERREMARDLVEKIVAGALDPRRDGDGLITAAEASRLAWEIEPELGRSLFDRTLRRGEILLASASTRDLAIEALPAVLASYTTRDADAAFAAAERVAAAAATGPACPSARS